MKKGIRVKFSHKKLIRNYILTSLILIFVICFLILSLNQFMLIEWSEVTLLNMKDTIFDRLDGHKLIINTVISFLISGGLVALFYSLRKSKKAQLKHRQAIARMIIENKWYESHTEQKNSFFKDLGQRKKEKVDYFPKVWYKLKKDNIYIIVAVTMGKFQEHFLNLEKRIESGLFCELVSKTVDDPYINYTFSRDLSKLRIDIDDVVISNNSIELMKGFVWNYNEYPHALIAGDTGSGKTYFLLTLIKIFLSAGAKLYLLDPKNTAVADLSKILNDVYYQQEDIIGCLDKFYKKMLVRSREMREMPNYKMGMNYSDLGLKPHFLIFDEYVAFVDSLDKKIREIVLKDFNQIALLGRESGFFLILGCQRPDSKFFGDGMRDQFHFRLALGILSDEGYRMMFGSTNKVYFQKDIKGRGYINKGLGIVGEFYAPYVPKKYDFMDKISNVLEE